MILLTRLNGPPFALNADLIERAEATPDTVITLVDGTKTSSPRVSTSWSRRSGSPGRR